MQFRVGMPFAISLMMMLRNRDILCFALMIALATPLYAALPDPNAPPSPIDRSKLNQAGDLGETSRKYPTIDPRIDEQNRNSGNEYPNNSMNPASKDQQRALDLGYLFTGGKDGKNFQQRLGGILSMIFYLPLAFRLDFAINNLIMKKLGGGALTNRLNNERSRFGQTTDLKDRGSSQTQAPNYESGSYSFIHIFTQKK